MRKETARRRLTIARIVTIGPPRSEVDNRGPGEFALGRTEAGHHCALPQLLIPSGTPPLARVMVTGTLSVIAIRRFLQVGKFIGEGSSNKVNRSTNS
jgi:hypothetical protein